MPGTPPGPFTKTWVANSTLTHAMLDDLAAYVNSLGRGFMDWSLDNSGSVTLATVGTSYAGTAASSATITLTETRRVKVTVQARFVPNSATGQGHYQVWSGYNSGSSIALGSATFSGSAEQATNTPTQTGFNGSQSVPNVYTWLLAPGTYTFYPIVQRVQGGDPGDTATSFYTLVEDLGSS